MAKDKSPSKERHNFFDFHGKHVDSKVPGGEGIKRAILKRMADKARNDERGLGDREVSSPPIAGCMEHSDLSDQREDVLRKAMSRLRRTFDGFPKSGELAAGASSQQNLANSINCLSQTVQCWGHNLRLIAQTCKDLQEKDALQAQLSQLILENRRLIEENRTMADQQSHLFDRFRKTEEQMHNLAGKLSNLQDQLIAEESNRLRAEEERDKALRERSRLLEDQHRKELEEAEKGIAAYLCTAHEIWSRGYKAVHPDGDPSFMSMDQVIEAVEAARPSPEEFDRERLGDKSWHYNIDSNLQRR